MFKTVSGCFQFPYHVSIGFQKLLLLRLSRNWSHCLRNGVLPKYVLLVDSFKASKLVRICVLVI